MQPDHRFTLSGSGLPQTNKQSGWLASDVWACFAADNEGQAIAESSHEALKQVNVWVWRQGSIEHVIGDGDKGEESIIEHERMLRDMTAPEIEHQMSAFKACFDWIKSL